jgi:hypothetical protein
VFAFDASARTAFQALKAAFTSAPILRHFDSTLETIIDRLFLAQDDASGT